MRRHSALFTSSVALVTAVIAMAGCNPHVLASVELDINAEDEEVLQLEVNKDVDVLFVIDNSGSMAQEQVTLGQNFQNFIKVLEADGVEANYRIGVTTTDNGNNLCATSGINDTTPEGGSIRATSCTTRAIEFEWPHSGPTVQAYDEACAALCPAGVGDGLSIAASKSAKDTETKVRPWIESIEGQTNVLLNGEPYDDMVQAFQCFGPQGVDGCGFESQLESQYKALARANSSNEAQYGFSATGHPRRGARQRRGRLLREREDCSVSRIPAGVSILDRRRAHLGYLLERRHQVHGVRQPLRRLHLPELQLPGERGLGELRQQ